MPYGSPAALAQASRSSAGDPAASVVITCFNHGAYLAEAIDSVFAQSRPACELIVVDDGSTDDTAAVARAYPQARYVWQANAGLAAARNTGLRHAAGAYVLFLDADDCLLPNALADASQALERAPEAAFAYGGFRLTTLDRTMLADRIPDPARCSYRGLLTGNHIAMHGTVLYRTPLLRAAGGFDPSIRACEDYDLYLRLSRAHETVPYFSLSADYRWHDANMSGDAARMLRISVTVLQRQRPFVRKSQDLRRAYAEGLAFWRTLYGERLVGQIRRRLFRPGERRAAVRGLATGLRYDPLFCWRIARAAARVAGRKAGPA